MTADAATLLERINLRNAARWVNLPTPELDAFSPRKTLVPPKAGDRCRKDGCVKARNKSCTFSLCKACCDNRPAGEKTCLTHRLGTKGSRAHLPSIIALRPSIPSAIPLTEPHHTTSPHQIDSLDLQATPTLLPLPTDYTTHLPRQCLLVILSPAFSHVVMLKLFSHVMAQL